jgi:hypothetical protein
MNHSRGLRLPDHGALRGAGRYPDVNPVGQVVGATAVRTGQDADELGGAAARLLPDDELDTLTASTEESDEVLVPEASVALVLVTEGSRVLVGGVEPAPGGLVF